jgi:hypothetical protein
MRCPVCDADNPADSPECSSCGKAFPSRARDGGAAGTLEGLETTQFASPNEAVRTEPLAGLEHTRLPEDRSAQSQWTASAVPLERTQHEVGVAEQGAWSAGIEVDPGREADSGERTPVQAETAVCPWCGTPSIGAICDACGRRKARFAAPPPERERRAGGEGTVTCPACFARVAREVRCSDCGMPFPLQEL